MSTTAAIDDVEGPSAPPEPRPWWRLPARWAWMLGIERSELEVQAFAGVIYAAVEGNSLRLPAMVPLAATLQALRSRPDMPAAMACERLYYEALTPADRRAELWSLRERFIRIAPTEAIAAFGASRLPDIAAASDDAIIAEVRTLLAYTHKSYQLTLVRELAAGRLKRWLLWWTVTLILAFAIAIYNLSATLGVTAPRSLLAGLAAIVLAGGVGAVMSVARRLQVAIANKVMNEDPMFEIAALELGRNGIMLSCLIGSVFALLVFAVLYGALGSALGLQGGFIFPHLSGAMLGQRTGLSGALGFAGDGDFARMLIIAFVAGFAERLVPDSIDRIVAQGERKK